MALGCGNIGIEFPKSSLGESNVHLELRIPGPGLIWRDPERLGFETPGALWITQPLSKGLFLSLFLGDLIHFGTKAACNKFRKLYSWKGPGRAGTFEVNRPSEVWPSSGSH